MEIHLLGHASLWIETQDCKILMDPVLQDPFCEGLNASCPQREIAKEQLSEYDFLVISHRHLDHFDLQSLAYLPKNVDVLIPQDDLIEDCLRSLGYSQIYQLGEFVKVRSGSTLMMTTRSEVRVPELGMVFADDSGVFWNTVDTYFAPPTIARVRSQFPEIDFLLTTWHISLEGKYQYNQSTSFPFKLYEHLLKLIELIEPKAIAPGAQGFKYIGEAAWQNQVVFPLTRERFCSDLKTVFPQSKNNIFALDPGDIIKFDRGNCERIIASSNYAKTTADDREKLDFAPVIAGNFLVDSNRENYPYNLVSKIIQAELDKLPQFINCNFSLFREHYNWQVIYQLEITFSDRVQKYWIDFSTDKITVNSGRNPKANLFSYITASTIYSLISQLRDWDYLICSGEYRSFDRIYRLTSSDLTYPAHKVGDPLEIIFSNKYIANNNIYRELSRYKSLSESNINTDNSIVNLGNILIKRKSKAISKVIE